ncbi:MAG: protein-L-isoaspartate O-methyltransferase [Dongiaceae bacterium]
MTGPTGSVEDARRHFAEELRYVAPVRNNEAVVRAFAAVPRERFLGPGPWRIFPSGHDGWITADDDPRHLYHNVLVVIDAARELNNGEPSLWAFLYDQVEIAAGERILHVGAGTGYYSAILAEMVGLAGRVVAVEHDGGLAARARANLAAWPQAEAVHGDGAAVDPGLVDLIIVNAGVTHPAPVWLESLAPGGRLLLPLTADDWWGAFLKVVRRPEGYAAAFVSRTGIFHCASFRDPASATRLRQAFARSRGRLPGIRSLRRDPEARDRSCWYHGPGFWLSKNPLPAEPDAPARRGSRA